MLKLTQPTLAVTGNLRWTLTGVVYAEWLLSPRPNGHERPSDRREVVKDHRDLFTDIPETILTTVVAPLDVASIAARLTATARTDSQHSIGSFLQRHPDYTVEASAQLNAIELQARPPHERIMWLSVPLCGPSRTGDLPSDFIPSDKHREQFDALADEIRRKIPASFAPTAVNATQMHWLWDRAHTRGLALDHTAADPSAPRPFPHNRTTTTRRGRIRGFRLSGELDETLATDDRKRRTLTRAIKTYYTDSELAPSYQQFLVVDDFATRMPWPGVADQIFAVLNHFEGAGIDFTIHTRKRDRSEALAANARALRQLSEQMDERSDEVSFAQNFLVHRGQQLAQYDNHLESRPSETEIQFCPIIAISAPSFEELEDRSREVIRTFNSTGVKLVAPYGAQAELWAASQPGYPETRARSDYTHFMPTDTFACFMPVTAPQIGDDSGPLIATNRLSGFHEPVHFDLLGATERDKSASFAMTGDLGSGKSVALKVISGMVVDLSGQVFAVDRSKLGEYLLFAQAVANAVVIDPANPTYTMDLLRVLPTADAAERILPVLMRLFQIKSGSPEAALLSDLIEPNYRARHRIRGLPDLVNHTIALARDHTTNTPAIETLAGQLRFWSQRTYARALFADDLHPLPLDAPMVVLRTHRLQLPAEEEQPADDPTKLFGEVIYALYATIAREALFASQARFGLLVLDEALHLTRSVVGQSIISEFVVDGRKHNAAIGIASQDPAHFGRFRRLIPTLFMFRQSDEVLAADSLKMASEDAAADHLVQQMTRFSPGECFMKDLKQRLGSVKIALPAHPDRARAVLTTPTREAIA
ncbi:hypothetical protein BTO20_38750 (plasmid) [Mycobacterium dioxanotrophicus]|uniref:ATP/GTP-binding protein n=1 Tax=Mycobacterium dioxanotrophicus TaxID=482462 RepID=A0A1Y0CHM3_9MYCO|nr:ATP-binding protein [Mycobacterium dioxanotrophicus]ART74534.1 hypothetical protein BTO20_38750 [Mycobacterium dioxanotrophicus]